MPWVLSIILVVITTACIVLSVKMSRRDYELTSCYFLIIGIVGVIITIISILNAICWTGCMINLEVYQTNVNAEGAAYRKLLNNYEQTLMTNDVTASESYLSLYEKILDYNSEVRRANLWKDTWGASGILYDPSYAQAELIPIDIE